MSVQSDFEPPADELWRDERIRAAIIGAILFCKKNLQDIDRELREKMSDDMADKIMSALFSSPCGYENNKLGDLFDIFTQDGQMRYETVDIVLEEYYDKAILLDKQD